MALKAYFNDNAPNDFRPEGFDPETVGEPDAFAFQRMQRVRINLGATATHHDALKVYMQTLEVRIYRLCILNMPCYLQDAHTTTLIIPRQTSPSRFSMVLVLTR